MILEEYQALADELTTVRDFFRLTLTMMSKNELFYGHGTDTAWDEALVLIFDTLHLPHDAQKIFLDAKLTNSEKMKLLDNIYQRVEQHKPVPYLTNKAWYADLDFFVDERVIIPRSPFAELIASGFSPWIEITSETKILDLCTGSACIAIACAYHFSDVIVDAIDISDEALVVAKINIEKHHIENQVNLIKSDLFTAIPDKQYDLIISNPPYVDAVDMASLPHEFKHEPTLALASGNDGLNATKTILQQAKNHLSENGVLIVEVGNSEEALCQQYPEVPFMWLEFERGGHGVFLLTKKQLEQSEKYFNE